jgi:hypothetical protein
MTRTEGAADSMGVDRTAVALSEVPQSAQNFAPEALSEPHFEHRFDKGLPHWAQNLLPALPSVPQFVQRIGLSYRENTHFCSTCAREAIYASRRNRLVHEGWRCAGGSEWIPDACASIRRRIRKRDNPIRIMQTDCPNILPDLSRNWAGIRYAAYGREVNDRES